MKITIHTAALANLNHWRAGQGAKIRANRPIEAYLACEHIAGQLSPLRDPLILSADEIDIAIKRAISQERRRLHGPLKTGMSADEWWSQITAIAERWGIKARREDWESGTAQREAA